jgi:hypothetical protein
MLTKVTLRILSLLWGNACDASYLTTLTKERKYVRFSMIAAVASVAMLTACSEAMSTLPRTLSAACAPKTQQNISAVPQNATAVPQLATVTPQSATAAQLGLWPRQGRSVRVCGRDSARYAGWLRSERPANGVRANGGQQK